MSLPIVINQDNLYLSMVSSVLSFSTDNVNWSPFNTQIQITPILSLNVQITSDLIIPYNYIFLTLGSNPTSTNNVVDGHGHTVYFQPNPDNQGAYPGFIKSGQLSLVAFNVWTVQDKGLSSLTIRNIFVHADVNAALDMFSGIVCQQYFAAEATDVTIDTCRSSSANALQFSQAGIVGPFSFVNFASGTISNCVNTADLSDNSSSSGIIGVSSASQSSTLSIIRCINLGSVGSQCSGIVGSNFLNEVVASYSGASAVVSDCINYGQLLGSNSCGILGTNSVSNANTSSPLQLTVQNCINYGDIVGSFSCGIIGSIIGPTFSSTIQITNCIVLGQITGEGSVAFAGDAFGQPGNTTTISNCFYFSNFLSSQSAVFCGEFCGQNLSIFSCVSSFSTVSLAGSNPVTSNIYVFQNPSVWETVPAQNTLLNVFSDPSAPGAVYYNYASGMPFSLVSLFERAYTPNYSYLLNNFRYVSGNREFIFAQSPGPYQFLATNFLPEDYQFYANNGLFIINPEAPSGSYYFIYSNAGLTNLLTFDLNAPCFLKGTQILAASNEYVDVEKLKVGDKLQIYLADGGEDSRPIKYIHRHTVRHFSWGWKRLESLFSLFYEGMTKPLILTGGHSVMVDYMEEDEIRKDLAYHPAPVVTEGKYHLLTILNKDAKLYNQSGTFDIYSIVLENKDNPFEHCIINANGLLVESCDEIFYLSSICKK